MYVQVASVDECGSYIGYGGAGDSEEEDDKMGSERGSRNGILSHSLSGHPVGWHTEVADADGDYESLSVEDKLASFKNFQPKSASFMNTSLVFLNAYLTLTTKLSASPLPIRKIIHLSQPSNESQ